MILCVQMWSGKKVLKGRVILCWIDKVFSPVSIAGPVQLWEGDCSLGGSWEIPMAFLPVTRSHLLLVASLSQVIKWSSFLCQKVPNLVSSSVGPADFPLWGRRGGMCLLFHELVICVEMQPREPGMVLQQEPQVADIPEGMLSYYKYYFGSSAVFFPIFGSIYCCCFEFLTSYSWNEKCLCESAVGAKGSGGSFRAACCQAVHVVIKPFYLELCFLSV